MIKPWLYIAQTKQKGRGVFTNERIPANIVVEESPVIVMTAGDRLHLDKTKLHDYIFEWGVDKGQCCMALGLIAIYNHSDKNNCEYFMDFDEQTIQVKTITTIEKGEELTINYNGDEGGRAVWFEVV